jgi:pimeloyl-ACP methyl ester carboxylesterase
MRVIGLVRSPALTIMLSTLISILGKHTNTEDGYVGFIGAAIKKLGLNKPIVCGASMAGQVCLAVAVRNSEVGALGTIPLQGSDYLNMDRQWHDRSPFVNQSLFNPGTFRLFLDETLYTNISKNGSTA